MSTLQAERADNLDSLMRERRPGFSMPRPFYTDADIFRIDMDRIIQRQWMYAGHISRIPHEGDYFVYELGEESVVIIRGRGGAVHAQFNVCRHRGSRVCLEREGHAKRAAE